MNESRNFENFLDGANDTEFDLLLLKLRETEKKFGRVPLDVTQGALAAFEFRTFDEDLAALLHDSADDADQLVAVRATALDGVRFMEFRVGEGQLQLGFTETLITGNVSGRSEDFLELVSPTRRAKLSIDEFGDFWCSDFDPGPIRFEIGSGDHKVVTDWVLSPRT